jgi:hypothetical protein
MKDLFCTYSQALALKELGFDEPCIYQYVRDFDNDGDLIPIVSALNLHILRNNTEISDNSGGDCFAAPLKSQVFKWFRDKYELSHSLDLVDNSRAYYYDFTTFDSKNRDYDDENCFDSCRRMLDKRKFETYEEAESSCIDKLIELVKEKKL